ncbi:hypothetical protein E2C01_072807 [Portunus trituberculatus]|uniref:Uncharacterized protein n=1 Tax=Portunus trituberculatus TaxID=210409 RepID=A0A5B7I7N4_PORTR|nr:hypothetical protein [Portunus trituberculatus]
MEMVSMKLRGIEVSRYCANVTTHNTQPDSVQVRCKGEGVSRGKQAMGSGWRARARGKHASPSYPRTILEVGGAGQADTHAVAIN